MPQKLKKPNKEALGVSAGANRPTLAGRWVQFPAALVGGQWACWNAVGGSVD